MSVVGVTVTGPAAHSLPVQVFVHRVKGQDAPPLSVSSAPPPLFDWPAVVGGGTSGGGAETGEGGSQCHCGDERVVRAGGTDDGGGGRY